MSAHVYVRQLNDDFFGGRLASAVVDSLAELPVDRQDVRAFAERMFTHMQMAGFPATEVSVFQAGTLGALLPRLLPGTWQGRVPPITVSGRHRKLDDLVKSIAESEGLGHTFIDVACGFPPLTTIDTADALAGWTVTGVDRSLPAFMVHDQHGNYAVFDREGRATYFQPLVPSIESWATLLTDWDASRQRFERLLQSLLAERERRGAPAGRFELDGASLVPDPVKAYERPALRFVASDLADAMVPPADVVRCCNMLLYFDDAFRRDAMHQLAALVREGGLLVCGTDWAHTTESRYFTYRKRGGVLRDGEFAFSIDNLAPLVIVPWYALHDDDRELLQLTELHGCLRRDRAFTDAFTRRSDELRCDLGVCARGDDGYYTAPAAEMPPAEIWRLGSVLSERLAGEFGPAAVDVLKRAGWRARMNAAGHIAVTVPDAD